MSKIKYKYNIKTLSYEKFETTIRSRVLKVLSYIVTGSIFAGVAMLVTYNTPFDTPKERKLRRELEKTQFQYEVMNGKLSLMSKVLADLQDRDDNLYRVIFEAEPIPADIRKAGYGGVDRYKDLEGFNNTELMKSTSMYLDQVAKEMYIQSKSFDEVSKLARDKEKLLASIPAIQPIANKDLKHVPSGYGWRTDPIYKTGEFHPGLDFTANTGTEIFATGDGVVERADAMDQGYGNHVIINHGFGYQTLYGHMTKFIVQPGQKVKRGELIGYVGSTGRSTGPHVHYEVIKNGEKVNPINYFFNDLSPEEYARMTEMASKPSQTFD
jgi:murein DD-endopeptidase MepM/ murein hydrolase activator NlpD